jgi:hypothetical protein
MTEGPVAARDAQTRELKRGITVEMKPRRSGHTPRRNNEQTDEDTASEEWKSKTAQEDQNPEGKQRDLTRVLAGTLPGKSDQNWLPNSRWRIDRAESRC